MPAKSVRMSRGFTLIELLVVIAIIAILMAILMPAVQSAREAARRTQCRNNISQLSLALHNYDMTFEMLPPGTVEPTGPIRNVPEGYHVSWLVQILPMMEQPGVFRHFNFDEGAYGPANAAVRNVEISVMACPSDFRRQTNVPGLGTVTASNYAGNFGGNDVPIDDDNNGLLFRNSSITFRQIRDGASNTLLIGEKVRSRSVPDQSWVSGTFATLRNTGILINESWDVRGYIRHTEPQTAPDDTAAGGFSSLHPGGATFAMADGSAVFLTESIDPKIYEHLGNREDLQIPERF